MSKKNLSLMQYGISQNRYRELYYHCLRYDEFKQREALRHKAEEIEAAAKAASPELYNNIIQNVAYGKSVNDMPTLTRIKQFYNARQKFYVILSQMID